MQYERNQKKEKNEIKKERKNKKRDLQKIDVKQIV